MSAMNEIGHAVGLPVRDAGRRGCHRDVGPVRTFPAVRRYVPSAALCGPMDRPAARPTPLCREAAVQGRRQTGSVKREHAQAEKFPAVKRPFPPMETMQ